MEGIIIEFIKKRLKSYLRLLMLYVIVFSILGLGIFLPPIINSYLHIEIPKYLQVLLAITLINAFILSFVYLYIKKYLLSYTESINDYKEEYEKINYEIHVTHQQDPYAYSGVGRLYFLSNRLIFLPNVRSIILKNKSIIICHYKEIKNIKIINRNKMIINTDNDFLRFLLREELNQNLMNILEKLNTKFYKEKK